MSRVDRAFATAREEGRAAFVPYLTAGFPDDEAFLGHARELLRHADVLEVGLPFSDPLGDGPTIQRSSERALRGGATVASTFGAIEALRRESDAAIVLMTYYNPVYAYRHGGEAGFLRDLKAAGADGLVLPDLPPDGAGELLAVAREIDLDTVFLVAPTSTEARLRTVTAACRGFVYAVSVTGVTGARATLPEAVPDLVGRVRAISDLPVAVGFGVSGADSARRVAEVADGVVVGSALVRVVDEGGDLGSLAADIARACREARAPADPRGAAPPKRPG